MEEKKLDINSIIGFVLIFGILAYMLWQNQPTPEELAEQEKAKQEQVEAAAKAKVDSQTIVTAAEDYAVANVSDSLQLIQHKNKLGALAYSETLVTGENETLVETDLFELKFNGRGGYLSEVKLKKFVDYNDKPIYIIKDKNAAFNINLQITEGRMINTKDRYFQQ